ncbi:hypothetical protein ACFW35_04225 [Fictibacillus sp. NPDC058756]
MRSNQLVNEESLKIQDKSNNLLEKVFSFYRITVSSPVQSSD